MNVTDLVLKWPLYVTDNGKVTCNHEECEEDDIDVPARRISVTDYLQAIRNHIHKYHSL